MKKNGLLVLLIGIITFSVVAQDLAVPTSSLNNGNSVQTPEDTMRNGLNLYKAGNYNDSLYIFREITLERDFSDFHGSAYFWIAKCYLALGNLDFAEENLNFFLEDFVNHPFYEEGVYQSGRLTYLKENYTHAIAVFYDFIDQYQSSNLLANAYFWIAESLFNLGHYPEAEKIYNKIVVDYSTSYKVETAKYKLSLIDLFDREEVLMDLLKLSHEEYIGSLEEFQRRERTYEQALGVYQRRILELTDALEAEKAAAILETNKLVVEIEETSGVSDSMLRLLELKNSVLQIKEYYIDLLENQYEGGM